MFAFGRYYIAALCTLWCYFNISVLPYLMNEDLFFYLPAGLQFPIYGIVAAVMFAPFIIGSKEFDKIGKSLTVDNSLLMTLTKLSPIIIVYLSVIVYIWYPKSGNLPQALVHSAENPNWFKLVIYAVVIHFIASRTAIEPYKYVTTALLGLLASQHLLKLYFWYRLDDGCRTDYDGYVECDFSYVQHMDRISEEAATLGLTSESLIAADLYIMMIYSIVTYIFISILKAKILRGWTS